MAPPRWAPLRYGVVVVLASLAVVTPARAQGAGEGFLFRTPSATLTLRGGYDRAGAQSDVFTFSTQHLTLGRGDFSGLAGGADLGLRLTPRVDLLLSGEYTGRVKDSEFRDFVGTDDRPILQTTRFERVPLTAAAKLYVAPRGRRIGRFAWVPARVAPFVGGGGGATWYRFRQEGEFVDYETLEIFQDRLESTGWAPSAQAFGGIDYALTPRLAVTGETRYTWSRARPHASFSDFDRIDLSGLAATVGVTLRF